MFLNSKGHGHGKILILTNNEEILGKYGINHANYLSGSGLACMASKEQTLQAFNFKSNLQTTPSICQPFAKHQYNRKCWSAAAAAATSGAATTGEFYFRFPFLRKIWEIAVSKLLPAMI